LAANPIDSLQDFTARGKGELKAWIETWMVSRKEVGSGSGGGGTTTAVRKLVATWSGIVPSVLGNGSVWRVPFDADGTTSMAFTLGSAFGRIETSATAATSWRLERMSPGADSAYAPTTITTVTVAASHFQTQVTGLSVVVNSGDLLRLVFTAVGSEGNGYHVELIGTQ